MLRPLAGGYCMVCGIIRPDLDYLMTRLLSGHPPGPCNAAFVYSEGGRNSNGVAEEPIRGVSGTYIVTATGTVFKVGCPIGKHVYGKSINVFLHMGSEGSQWGVVTFRSGEQSARFRHAGTRANALDHAMRPSFTVKEAATRMG